MNVSANTRPVGQPRGIGFGILLFIVTLGFYGWYWVYQTEEEMKQHTGDGLGGVLGLVIWILLSPVMAFVIPSEVGKMYEKAGGRRDAHHRHARTLSRSQLPLDLSETVTNECLGFHPAGIIGELARSIINARRRSAARDWSRRQKEAQVGLLLALVLLLVLIGIIGGVAITKFLFFALVIAALVALIGFFARTA